MQYGSVGDYEEDFFFSLFLTLDGDTSYPPLATGEGSEVGHNHQSGMMQLYAV